MSNKSISVYSKALVEQARNEPVPKARADKPTSQPTQTRDTSRDNHRDSSRDKPRDSAREKPRAYPTRDEVQAFSFQLRDELKVKVQAEVPHTWQKELDEIARKMDVKKLELYRYILGEFLGKVQRQNGD